jgi:uncharacterized protein YjaZ
MESHWVPTHEYYRQLIAAPNMAERLRLYRELFIAPWKPMMDMTAPMFGADPADDLAVARAWGWALPEDLTQKPAALDALEQADAWSVGAQALATGLNRLAPFASQIPFQSVAGWLVVAEPERSDPSGRGYTGAIDWTQPRFVAQFDTPNDYNLPRLPGLIVHELHHLVRLSVFPWDMNRTSVADYIVHEGLAESFATALYGPDVLGYYVSECDDVQLETARNLVEKGLHLTGFDVTRGYIFGDHLAEKFGFVPVGMPDYGGYAVGYHVVQAYLQHTGQSVEEATFVPAAEIVDQSGFFQA